MPHSSLAARISQRKPDGYWHATFTVWVDSDPRPWSRSLATRDAALARHIADALELVGRGAMTIEAMIQFLESITDQETRRALARIFRAIAVATIGPPYDSKLKDQ